MKSFFIQVRNSVCVLGFTLVELLISMFLILSITAVVMTIFVAGLRGSSQSSAQVEVRQNGDLATLEISRMIRSAQNFNGVSVDGSTGFTSSCYAGSVSGPTPTPQQYKSVQITGFDGGVTNISCPLTDTQTAISSTSAGLVSNVSLTDSVAVTVLPSSCYFTCQQQAPTDLPVIGVNFTMQSNKVSGASGQSVSQDFHTSVVPRNYLR
jgi:type II secretory pathway pseudopilin PulG